MANTIIENPPLACDLTLIPASAREQHVGVNVPALFGAVQEVRELLNGYAFRIPNTAGMFLAMAQFVENERLCCPFFNFVLEVESQGGALWLRLTGDEGVKQLLLSGLGEHVNQTVLRQLIRTGNDDSLDEVVVQTHSKLRGVIRSD
jgi:hypothetical protein